METDLPAGLWKIIPPEQNAGHRGGSRGSVLAPVCEEQASRDPIQQLALMCTLWLTRHLEEAGGDPHVVGNAALVVPTGLPADTVHLELRVVLLLCQGLRQEAPVEAPDGGGHLHGAALEHGAAQGDTVPHALPHVLEGWLHHGWDWRPNRATDREQMPSGNSCLTRHGHPDRLWQDRYLWFPRGWSQGPSHQKQQSSDIPFWLGWGHVLPPSHHWGRGNL